MPEHTTINRKTLMEIDLPAQNIDAVQVHEITMMPGQIGGLHLHPCPVTGYIIEGIAVMQIEGEGPQILPAGSPFYEPANVRIQQFGNYAKEAPMKFIAFYLLNGQQELIKML